MSVPEKENSVSDSKKKVSYAKALKKLSTYCAYQERSIFEVMSKLEELEVNEEDAKKVFQTLQEQDFINEKRFVESFVRGRFGLKRWGRIRIRQELKMRDISDHLIMEGLDLLEPDEYHETLVYLAERKWKLTKETNLYKKKAKVVRFLIFRGFESEMVWEVVRELSNIEEA
jgi:regulatory protein